MKFFTCGCLSLILFCLSVVWAGGPAANAAQETLASVKEFPRNFLPEKIDLTNWIQVEPYYQNLLKQEINSTKALEKWLLDWSELDACLLEELMRFTKSSSSNSSELNMQRQYHTFIDASPDKVWLCEQNLRSKYLDCPYRSLLDAKRYVMLNRSIVINQKFSKNDKTIVLMSEDYSLRQEYDKISSGIRIDFDGRQRTLAEASLLLESSSRYLRQEIWLKLNARWQVLREPLNKIFDRMVELRTQVAQNAGFDNYLEYIFLCNKRIDYTKEDCRQLYKSVENCVAPAVRRLITNKKNALKIEHLLPWDQHVDIKKRPPLRPFPTAQALKDGVARIFKQLDPLLAEHFAEFDWRGNIDLDNYCNKEIGAYSFDYPDIRQPHIAVKTIGASSDFNALLHESGHAFHSMCFRNEPLFFYRYLNTDPLFNGTLPLEFSEVASMTMELLSAEHFSAIFSPEESNRAKRQVLNGILSSVLMNICQMDAFQQWIYTQPKHTHEERSNYWIELDQRFDDGIEWNNYPEARETQWQHQPHIFKSPLYAIEYVIAEIGALQIWRNYKKNPEEALEKYRYALSLGGSRPLPELFEAAGAKFDFSEQTLRPLVELVEEELNKIPESMD